jgi:hypothetical protein
MGGKPINPRAHVYMTLRLGVKYLIGHQKILMEVRSFSASGILCEVVNDGPYLCNLSARVEK